jgi:hypothetical protein
MYRKIMARCTDLGVYWVVGFPMVPHVAFPDLYDTHHRLILFGLSDMKNRDRGIVAPASSYQPPTTSYHTLDSLEHEGSLSWYSRQPRPGDTVFHACSMPSLRSGFT